MTAGNDTSSMPSGQPWANNQLRVGAVLVLAVAVGLGLYFGLHHSSANTHKHKTSSIGPIGYTASALKRESSFINTKFYWAGPQQGDLYEFTRNTLGYLFVRYLPSGVQVGAPGANFLIVSTYPFPGGYDALRAKAKSRAIPGPNGSIIFVDPKHKTSAYMAWPGINDQVEVYAPQAQVALNTARSGKIKPVR